MPVVGVPITSTTTTTGLGSITANELRRRMALWLPDNAPLRGFIYTLNAVIQQIYDRGKWSWRLARDTFQWVAAYETGTCTITKGSATITGASTVWTSGMVGRKIRVANGPAYTIATRVGNTEITVTETVAEDSASSLSYVIYQDEYSMASDVGDVLCSWDITDNLRLIPEGARDLKTFDVERYSYTHYPYARCYSLVGRDGSQNKLYRFMPYPTEAHIVEVWYFKKKSALTGPNSVIDVPDDMEDVVLQGCFATIQRQVKAEQWQPEYNMFKTMLESAWKRDVDHADFVARMARQDRYDGALFSKTTGTVTAAGA
jgi:hypothetical protein